jgi:predicted nucleic acid-binding protein
MKVVIDTNILVSAAIRDGIPETVIQFIVDRLNLNGLYLKKS